MCKKVLLFSIQYFESDLRRRQMAEAANGTVSVKLVHLFELDRKSVILQLTGVANGFHGLFSNVLSVTVRRQRATPRTRALMEQPHYVPYCEFSGRLA
jgi:hypothetical protein